MSLVSRKHRVLEVYENTIERCYGYSVTQALGSRSVSEHPMGTASRKYEVVYAWKTPWSGAICAASRKHQVL